MNLVMTPEEDFLNVIPQVSTENMTIYFVSFDTVYCKQINSLSFNFDTH